MHAVWDITSKCNLSCIHCYNSRLYSPFCSQDLVLDLRTNEVYEILDKLAEGGVETIQFLGGEPFIRPDFLDILVYAKQKRLNCRIATNGVLLNETLIEELARIFPEQIVFSIEGARRESNDAIRGKGTFDRAINNLKLLSNYFRDNRVKTIIGIQCTLTRANKNELAEMVNLCKELNLDLLGFEPLQIYSQDPSQRNKLKGLILDSLELLKAGGKIAALMSSNQNKIEIRMGTLGAPRFIKYLNQKYGMKLQVGRRCPAASDIFYIRADAIVHPCNYCSDLDENIFCQKVKKEKLDLRVLSFEEVVDSEYFKTFHYFAHDGEIFEQLLYCKKCECYEICEPCPLDVVRFGDRVASQCLNFEKYRKEATEAI
ncbi:MAG: radical SAM protein [Candidatus Zixiibacteriota bacterium]